MSGLRRAGRIGALTLAILLIVLAALLALGQLLVPLAAHYPRRVAQLLSEQLHQPVRFASMDGYWQPSGPLLVLHQVRIGEHDGEPALVLPSARVKLDFGALLWPSRHWVNLRLTGMQLTLRHDARGRWHVAGFGVAGAGRGQAHHVTLGDLPGNLWLDDSELDIDDVAGGHRYHVRAGPLRISNGAHLLRFAGILARGGQRVRVAGRVSNGGTSGRLYLGMNRVNLARMLANAGIAHYAVTTGHGEIGLWLGWHRQQLTALTARVGLADLTLHGPSGSSHIPQLRGLVRYWRQGSRGEVVFAPGARGAVRASISGIDTDPALRINARDVDPGGWLALAMLMPQVPAAARQWLHDAAPHLNVASAHAAWSQSERLSALDVRFDDLGFAAADGKPGIDRAHGVLRGDAEALSLHLPQQALTLDYRPMFRWPFKLSQVGGDVALWSDEGGWTIGVEGLSFVGKNMAGRARGSVRLPSGGEAPVLDMYALLTQGNVAQAKRFLPVTIMGQSAVHWLDHSLHAGRINAASVIMHGDMADWPFRHHEGRFDAHVDISGLKLNYQPDWPQASGIAVKANFVNDGLSAKVTAAQVKGVKVTRAVASIPEFDRAELILSAHGTGTGPGMMDFLRASPMGKPHADILDQLKLGGRGDFDFALTVPLSKRAKDPFKLGGDVTLHDADVDAAPWKLHLGDLDGRLHFDNKGLAAKDLHATYQGQPVTLDMDIGPNTGHPSWPLKVSMHGDFSLAQLIEGRDELQSFADMAHGKTHFDIGFHIDDEAANPVHATEVLRVRSSLRGMALNLPAPLAKPAPAAWPLDLELGLPLDGAQMRVILGNRLQARARLPAKGQPLALNVKLGGGAPADGLPSEGIHIRGHAQKLDVSGWVRYALGTSGGSEQGMPPLAVDVMADAASVYGHDFKDLHIKLHPEKSGLKLSLDGPQIAGTTTVPIKKTNQRGIVARFDKLYWPKSDKPAKPAAEPAAAASTAIPTPQQAAAVGVAPASVPPLHVWIGDLRFGDARLGQVRLETRPTRHGMHIDMLRMQSPSMNIGASGAWTGTAENSHTHMNLRFDAKNLGKMLDAFGYNGVFHGGQTRLQLDATWPGAPTSFELANLEGTLGIDIGKGRIPEVKPGVGRLLGLMSIVELPRRLSLDFGDVFGKGLGFDSITGHFRFADGSASTRDLKLKGSAVSISVTGRVNFRSRDYDQYVLAIPHVGNSLPVVGAVVGGPVGAAAGFAVQGLLGKGLNKAASVRYHITGPWADPTITRVDKHEAEQAPPASATSSEGTR